jgi:hypothetical protein
MNLKLGSISISVISEPLPALPKMYILLKKVFCNS